MLGASANASETRQPVAWSTPHRVRTGRVPTGRGGEKGGALVGGQVEVLAPGVTLRVGSV